MSLQRGYGPKILQGIWATTSPNQWFLKNGRFQAKHELITMVIILQKRSSESKPSIKVVDHGSISSNGRSMLINHPPTLPQIACDLSKSWAFIYLDLTWNPQRLPWIPKWSLTNVGKPMAVFSLGIAARSPGTDRRLRSRPPKDSASAVQLTPAGTRRDKGHVVVWFQDVIEILRSDSSVSI